MGADRNSYQSDHKGFINNFVCTVDVGSTGIKAGLVDDAGAVVACAHRPTPQDSIHDDARFAFRPEALLDAVGDAVREAVAISGLPPAAIRAVGIASQRATVIGRDAAGEPIFALSWQDNRCAEEFERFATNFGPRRFYSLTGMPPGPIYSLGKLLWVRKVHPRIFARLAHLSFVADDLVASLTGAAAATDPSLASTSGLFEMTQRQWNEELVAAAGLQSEMLPAMVDSGTIGGRLNAAGAARLGLEKETPVLVAGGDQQIALLGSGVFEEGVACLGAGTGAFLTLPVRAPLTDFSRGFACTAYVLPDHWVMEGFLPSFLSTLNWFAALTGRRFENLETMPDARGAVHFLPFLAGVGAPDCRADLRGCFIGLSLETTAEEMAGALLRGLAFETRRVLEAMSAFRPIDRVILVGGGGACRALVELMATVFERPLLLSVELQATLRGAAAAAWTALGRFPSVAEAARAWRREDAFEPIAANPALVKPDDYADYLEEVDIHMKKGKRRS
jgi:sugar (pentulose or hexulose) kinase